MTWRTVAVAIAAIAGVFIGRATVSPAPSVVASPHPRSPAPPVSVGTAHDSGCESELRSTKAQLAICMAYEQPTEEPGEEDDRARERERVRRNREVMATCPNYLGVQRTDGSMGLFPPEEWDGEGLIVARKLPSGEIGWYAGPDAGPRSDPAAFRAAEPGSALNPLIERADDGTMMVNGKPGERALQRMFGGKEVPDASP